MGLDYCCVFQPAFGCCAHPKAGRTPFFCRFQPFLFILNPFQFISVTEFPLRWCGHPNIYMFFFVHFQTFFIDFRHEITEKGLK